jgi:hypothetical protein
VGPNVSAGKRTRPRRLFLSSMTTPPNDYREDWGENPRSPEVNIGAASLSHCRPPAPLDSVHVLGEARREAEAPREGRPRRSFHGREAEAPHEGDERTGLSPPASAQSWLPERFTLLAAEERGLQRRRWVRVPAGALPRRVRLDASASPYLAPPPSSPMAHLPRSVQL